jgi:chromosome segregation ATPase
MTARTPTSVDLSREVLSEIAGLKATVASLDRRVDGVQTDAREARDAARDTLAATTALNLPAQIEHVRGELDKAVIEQRSDLVNSIARVTAELREKHDAQARLIEERTSHFAQRFDGVDSKIGAIDGRVDTLERANDGPSTVWKWLADHMPWVGALLAVVVSVYAAISSRH